jgi:hypothetical protein
MSNQQIQCLLKEINYLKQIVGLLEKQPKKCNKCKDEQLKERLQNTRNLN